jgi:flagellar hook-associated protein 2
MAVNGVGGGAIDVAGIVSQLMTIEQQPLAKMQQNLSGIQTKLSAWGKVQAAVSNLRDATRALTRNDTWQASKAASSDEASITATGGGSAASGNYSLSVQSLAQSQSVVSRTFTASDTVVGGGTLQIQLGNVDATGANFIPDPDRTTTVTVAAGATLADIRSAINNSDAGVSASILEDGIGKRLVLTSRESGQSQAFQISATEAGEQGPAGLTSFSVSATAASGANGTLRTQLASDARLTINGLPITGGSNKLDGVIEGVTLNLRKVTTAPVEVTVGSDQEATKATLDKFITAYNDLNKLLAEQTRYDPATKTAGVLQGNSVAVRMQQQIREQMRSTVDGDASSSLSAAGFEIAQDGSLSIKADKMTVLLSDPAKLRQLFAGPPPAAGQPTSGIARLLDQRLTSYLDPEGAISSATDSLRTREDSIEKQQERFQTRLGVVEARLTRQYTALDVNLSRITSSFSAIQGLLNQGND